jgi:hypothetical protein
MRIPKEALITVGEKEKTLVNLWGAENVLENRLHSNIKIYSIQSH